ncbi:MAG: AbrB/MazE/SpoVT family DNA-binding domain-containing protein [Deltaproteobacteria bacterium]|nr:AbrB/MazE/SpoVT family DNA-binding domain-containing protein [Deltaproteobacteria bacterium]
MATATVSTKGQIVIPAPVREELGLGAGSRVEFVKTADGYLLKAATGSITALKGILGKPGKPVTVEMMTEAARRRAGR